MNTRPAPNLIYGWKSIAEKLRCSVRKAQALMELPLAERPPIYRDHCGICAIESKLDVWMDAQFMELGTYRELQRGRRAAEKADTAAPTRGTRSEDADAEQSNRDSGESERDRGHFNGARRDTEEKAPKSGPIKCKRGPGKVRKCASVQTDADPCANVRTSPRMRTKSA